jgi:cytochrome oxidase Cu insertion factor (SCO1/SenC/PrrC family)
LLGALVLALPACGDEAVAGKGASSGPATAAAANDAIAFAEVPDFTLITQDGDELTRADLAGRPWVLACIFTLCTGPCPSITKEVARLERKLDDVDVRFVSLSVDPARDKPHMLQAYAEAYQADTTRWTFATGTEAEVATLVREGFKLPFAKLDEPDPETGDLLTHDQRLTVIDAQGRIRGWYDSQDPDQMALLAERVRFLARAAAAE